MSLSKNIHRCRKSLPVALRHYSGSSNAVNQPKPQPKVMSLTQVKLLNQIKDYFTKSPYKRKMKSAIQKEITQLLQKLQPNVYSVSRARFIDTTVTNNPKDLEKTENPAKPKEEKSNLSGYTFSNVLNGLKIKINSKEVKVKPKWKEPSFPMISKSSIISRSNHLMLSLATAESDKSMFVRVEDLIDHLKRFPEAKSALIKEGVIRLLLRMREQTANKDVCGALNEAFALLGYCNPLPGRGIRILAIDGGGIRGLLVIEMLKKLEELSGKKVHEMFDYICGVSTGAIIACSVGLFQMDIDVVEQKYRDLSIKVFNQSTIRGTSSLVWSHAYYDTELWEKTLQEYLGDDELITTARNPNCPKLSAISAIVNQSKVSAYLFRNYSLPSRVQSQYAGGHNHKVWQAVRASAAAPTYFEECKLGNFLLQDGGILVNNPTAVAIHEAKLLWPNHPIQCVVSFGTGRTVPTHLETVTNVPASTISTWTSKLNTILDSATDTEGVHTMLNDLLPEHIYFRFNPYLTEMLSMSETNPIKLEQLQRDAIMYLRRNEDTFQEAAKVLCETKGRTQKAIDWMNLQRDLLGLY